MVELVFVIVVIGILASVAIPKFSATRDDATVTKASTTVASVRSALSQEVQRRQMAGNYNVINNVGGQINQFDKPIFDFFDGNTNGERVLEYPLHSCKNSSAKSCWMSTGNSKYEYIFSSAVSRNNAVYNVSNNRFDCVGGHETQCRILER